MIDYSELLSRYNSALSEIERLKKENSFLRTRLLNKPESEVVYEPPQDPTPNNQTSEASVDKFSPPEKKIALFRSLFRGRDDVFARRWYSKTIEKGGYQPVCENEWTPGVCNKKAFRFRVFQHTEPQPINRLPNCTRTFLKILLEISSLLKTLLLH